MKKNWKDYFTKGFLGMNGSIHAKETIMLEKMSDFFENRLEGYD